MADHPRGQLYLVRHGATEWSRSGKHTGRTDLDLTDEGVEEARSLGGQLAHTTFVEIRSSPLRRATRTAELAGLTPFVEDEDLLEWDYGGYDGLSTPEIRERLGYDWSVWTDPVEPGRTPGETAAQVGERADRVIAEVLPRLDEGDAAVVAHAHSLRILTARWLGLEATAGQLFHLQTASFSVLGFEHERRALHRWSVR